MYDSDSAHPTPVIGDTNPQSTPEGGLGPRLRALWQRATRLQKLLVGGVAVFIVAAIILITFLALRSPSPTPGTTQKPGSPTSQAPATDTPQSGESTDKADGTTPEAVPGASNGQKKSTGGAGGSTGGGTSGGGTSSSGSSGGGSSGGGSPSCALPNYPDESCTGVPAGTTLTVVNGDMNITTAGTVIEGKDIRGCVIVDASNVTIRKSKVTCSGYAITNAGSSSTGLLVEDVEVSCNGLTGTNAITSHDYTARRVNVHDCNDVLWAQSNVLIEDSYIHHVTHYYPEQDNHTDGVQIPENQSNVTVRHNRIYGNYESQASFGNAAITAQGGGNVNVLIVDNLLAGGGYTLGCYDVNSPTPNGPNTNFRIINNHFSTIFTPNVGGFGPWVGCQDEAQVTGNVYHETGQPVPF